MNQLLPWISNLPKNHDTRYGWLIHKRNILSSKGLLVEHLGVYTVTQILYKTTESAWLLISSIINELMIDMIHDQCQRHINYAYMTFTSVYTWLVICVMNGSLLWYLYEDIPWSLVFIWWIFTQRKQRHANISFHMTHRIKWIYCW